MTIKHIVARSQNKAIGKENTIPWHFSEDFQYFKEQTLNKPIIMGRKTFDSIGKPLPSRINIVVTRNQGLENNPKKNLYFVDSLEKALNLAQTKLMKLDPNNTDCFICGGTNIYDQTFDEADELYVTEIGIKVEKADAFYNNSKESQFSKVSIVKESKNSKLKFYKYERPTQ